MTQEENSSGAGALGNPVTQGDRSASRGSGASRNPVRPRRWILSEINSWNLLGWVMVFGAIATALGTVAAIVTVVRGVPRVEVLLPPQTTRDDMLVPGVVDNTQQMKLERQFRTEGFRQRNGHCTEPTYPLFSFHASEGWTIDRTSVEVRCHESTESTCNGLRDITERSFNYSCTVANSGFCIPPFIRDGRGACWGEIEWTEQRVIDWQSDSHAEKSNCDETTSNESGCRSGQ